MSRTKRVAPLIIFVTTFSAFAALPAVNASPTLAQTCANEAIRQEQGPAALALPDCRAYEMVSPSGSVPSSSAGGPVASASGQRLGYYALEPSPGSDEEGLYLLATRGVDGWSAQNTTPPQGGLHDGDLFACFPSVFYSAELTSAVLVDGWNQVTGGRDQICEGDYPPLIPGEPRGYANLFLRDDEDGSYHLIDRSPEAGPPADALLRDGSSDLSRVVFSEEAKLTPEAPAGMDLYEWTGSADRLVTFLPDGEPVQGTLANTGAGHDSATFTHAVSADGETVFFYAGGALYARLRAGSEQAPAGACSAGEPTGACTVQVDAAQAGAPGPGGGGVFMDASEDGSRVFFTDERKLTTNAVAMSRAPDLYEYNLATGVLTDLTVPASGLAEVLGFSGASGDGSYVYFVAKSVLSGAQTNSYGESAERYKPNLYVSHAGTVTFIATLEAGEDGDALDWGEEGTVKNSGQLQARVSTSGRYLVFQSVRPLDPSYNNEPFEASNCNSRCKEVYLYDAGENKLNCASCAPNGELPSGPAEIPYRIKEIAPEESPEYLPRDVSDDGAVFFDTRSPLVPQAVDGEINVYEYDAGVVHLISSGTAVGASEFMDASVSGEDVFFSTAQSLVRSDTDNMLSVYDARVNGGFPAATGEEQQASACESAEACKPAPTEPPAQLSAGSATLSAGGNLLASPVPVTPPEPAGGKAVGKRELTRAQKLTRALRECAGKPRRRRAACRAIARRRFGTEASRRKPRKHVRRASKSGRRSLG